MIEADLGLLLAHDGQKALPEWSKVEKLRDFYRTYAEAQAPCAIAAGEEFAVRLFVSREWFEIQDSERRAGRLAPDTPFQFYGASRLRVERSDKEVTRQYAFPIHGAARIAEVVREEDLDVLLEDLAQLKIVTVPRFRLQEALSGSSQDSSGDCFLVSNATVVPSRVFDEKAAEDQASSLLHLTLRGRKLALENVAGQTQWLQRIDSEVPGCQSDENTGYWDRQVTSLNLTVQELIPDMDFVAQSIRFWRAVEQRIQELREEEESWKKELSTK